MGVVGVVGVVVGEEDEVPTRVKVGVLSGGSTILAF